MENLKQRLIGIRNNLYDNMPTGKIDAFELTSVINAHLTELDNFIDNECDGYTLPDTESKCNKHIVSNSEALESREGVAVKSCSGCKWLNSDDRMALCPICKDYDMYELLTDC